MNISVVVAGQRELLEVDGALDPAGRLARRLDGREQECDQERDHGDDDEHLDESEAGAVGAVSRGDESSHDEDSGECLGSMKGDDRAIIMTAFARIYRYILYEH